MEESNELISELRRLNENIEAMRREWERPKVFSLPTMPVASKSTMWDRLEQVAMLLTAVLFWLGVFMVVVHWAR